VTSDCSSQGRGGQGQDYSDNLEGVDDLTIAKQRSKSVKNKEKQRPSIKDFFQQKLALFSRKKPTKREEG